MCEQFQISNSVYVQVSYQLLVNPALLVSILIQNFGAALLQSHLHRRNPWLKTPAEILQALPFVISSDALYKEKTVHYTLSYLDNEHSKMYFSHQVLLFSKQNEKHLLIRQITDFCNQRSKNTLKIHLQVTMEILSTRYSLLRTVFSKMGHLQKTNYKSPSFSLLMSNSFRSLFVSLHPQLTNTAVDLYNIHHLSYQEL